MLLGRKSTLTLTPREARAIQIQGTGVNNRRPITQMVQAQGIAAHMEPEPEPKSNDIGREAQLEPESAGAS